MKCWLIAMMIGLILIQLVFHVSCMTHPFQNALENFKVKRMNETINIYNHQIKKLTGKENSYNESIMFNTSNKNLMWNRRGNKAIIREEPAKAPPQIESVYSKIRVEKDKTYGQVFESVKFRLEQGVYSSLIRKISLGGTADSHRGIKLFSSDLKLTSAKVTHNCLESSSFYDHPYICISASFDPIHVIDSLSVEIEYEYISENLLRKRDKPFISTEEENVLVWIYDNDNISTGISKLKLDILFENDINIPMVKAYPERVSIKKKTQESPYHVISWPDQQINPDSFRNFALNIPIFNHFSKEMNEVHFDITSSSAIHVIISVSIVCGLMVLFFFYTGSSNQNEELQEKEREQQSMLFQENGRSCYTSTNEKN